MRENKEKETRELFLRLDDLKKCAIRGEIGVSAFFSPRESFYAKKYLDGRGDAYIAFGGYRGAQRERIYLLPEYMESTSDVYGFSDFGSDSGIAALMIKGSGFVRLSHRDFMGALLGLGIERSVLGDIVTLDESSAVVFCDTRIAEFLAIHLETVGRDKVKIGSAVIGEDFTPEIKVAPIGDTVASPRLDCVVGALCSLSRERAKEAICEELVELDYESVTRPDKEIVAPCLISVRGYGKFRILSLSDRTKKGRYRLLAEKFL